MAVRCRDAGEMLALPPEFQGSRITPLRSVSFLDPRVEAVDLDATPTRIVTKVVDTRCLARIISRRDLQRLSDRAAFA